MAFWSGVYGPALSFSSGSFGEEDTSSLAGLHGIFVNLVHMNKYGDSK